MGEAKQGRREVLYVALAAIGTVLLVLAFLISLVEVIAFDRSFYTREYAKNATAIYVGVSPDTLDGATDALLEYLQGRRASLDMEAQVGPYQREFYSEREKLHMADVRDLNMGAYAFMWTGFVAGTLLLVVSFGYSKKRYRVWGACFFSILGVLLAFGLIGMWAAFDFTGFWTAFHHVFFRNDLWLFDPMESLLIRMFEERFFFDLVGLILAWFLSITGAALLVSGLAYRAGKRRARREDDAPPLGGPGGESEDTTSAGQEEEGA